MTQLLRLSALHSPTAHLGDHCPLPRQAPSPFPTALSFPSSSSLRPASSLSFSPVHTRPCATDGTLPVPGVGGSGGGNSSGGSAGGQGGRRGSGGDGGASGDSHRSDPPPDLGLLGLFLEGWRSRVSADPQFPFKVLMEELVGVTACVLGDMASRPNFGLNELDFVFSTLVVGSILNFVLMYLLAPTAATSASAALPGLFARCPPSHMFEPGAFSLLDRMGTFVYKGALFAAVGFAAGLAGTAISNGLIALRKKMDPAFETPNKPPPTVLNSLTWAIHMGVSSNLRYQTLNGVEFLISRVLPPAGFKASVVVLRCLNNVLGGVSFVLLARVTGSQKVEEGKAAVEEVKEKLLFGEPAAAASENRDGELQRTESDRLTSSK